MNRTHLSSLTQSNRYSPPITQAETATIDAKIAPLSDAAPATHLASLRKHPGKCLPKRNITGCSTTTVMLCIIALIVDPINEISG